MSGYIGSLGQLVGELSVPEKVNVQANKSVSPSTSELEVTPDEGYDAMAQVTVGAIGLENKSVTPKASEQTISAGENYDGLGTVTVAPDNAMKASQADSGTDPVTLDFSQSGGTDFGGWGQYFRSTSEDTSTSAGASAWGSVRKCKVKLPATCEQIHARAFCGMSGLVELDASAVEGTLFVGSRGIFAVPNLATAGTAFWQKLKSVTSNSIRPVGGTNASIFEQGNDIVAPNLDTVVQISGYDTYCFSNCGWRSFTAPKLPKVSEGMFQNCKNMTTADFTAVASIATKGFANCIALTDLYLRGDSVVTLDNVDAFAAPNFTLHVPADLVDSYKAANNWSTLYNSGAGISIVAISE